MLPNKLGQMKGTVHTLEECAIRKPLRRSPPFQFLSQKPCLPREMASRQPLLL